MNYKLLIQGTLLGGLIIIGASVYIGFAGREAEVTDNAYEAGLHFDEAAKNKARLGWRVELPRTVHIGADEKAPLTVAIKDRGDKPVDDAVVRITLNRMGSLEERSYRCSGGPGGMYTARPDFSETGYWEARIQVARSREALSFEDQINVVR
jgi:nitrogen fixation protein FixH